MDLMPHNAVTLAHVENFVSNGKNCCVVNPCGSGKTSVMSSFIKSHPESSFLVVTKQKNAKSYYESRDEVFCDPRVKIITFNRMLLDTKAEKLDGYKRDFYIVDEAHYLGAPQWSVAFTVLTDKFHPTLIGLTATPQRFADRGTDNTIVKEFFGGNSAGNFTAKQLEERKVFVEPKYVLTIYNFDSLVEEQRDRIICSDLEEADQDALQRQLDDALAHWNRFSKPETIFARYLPDFMYKKKCNRILVYISGFDVMAEQRKRIDEWVGDAFPGKTILSYRYTYKDPESNLRGFLEEDKTDIKVLYTIDKIMETVHIDDLRIVIMLRPSLSERIIIQQLGRINSITNKDQPIIIDMVDNLSKLNKGSNIRASVGTETPRKKDTNSEDKVTPFRKPSLPHLSYYADIFRTVDKALRRVKYFTYRGFTGTLREIAEVFCFDYQELKNRMALYNDFDVAVRNVSKRRYQVSQEIFDGISYDTSFDQMSEQQRAYAERNFGWIGAYIARRHIQDEDLRQEMYVRYLKAVVETDSAEYKADYMRKQKIATSVHAFYLQKMRYEVIRSYLWADESYNEALAEEPCEDMLDVPDRNGLTDELNRALQSLSEREQKVLKLRYGLTADGVLTLDAIGEQFGVGRERIRQIEAKALRRLRHPTYSRPLFVYLR